MYLRNATRRHVFNGRVWVPQELGPYTSLRRSSRRFFRIAGGAGQTFCIRAGQSGNGSAWDNAFGSLPATLNRGDTYYVAGGSYSSYVANDGVSGTTPIVIKKAIESDHGPSQGWQSSFGTAQAVFSNNFQVTTSYWIIDGQTGGGPGAFGGSPQWKSGLGFKVDGATGLNGNTLEVSDPAHDVWISHWELQGHGPDDDTDSQDGINVGSEAGGNPTDTIGNNRFSYMWIYDMGRCPIFSRSFHGIFEYIYTGVFESTSTEPNDQHAEIASISRDLIGTPMQDVTFRYCLFTFAGAPDSTGGIMYEGDGLKVHGCVFAPVELLNDWGNFGNGIIGTWSASAFTNGLVYYCTFIGLPNRAFGLFNANDSIEARNNLHYNGDVGNDSGGYNSGAAFTHTHNHYVSITDGPITEATQTTASGDPFEDWPNSDFRLKVNTAAGTTLGSPYEDADMFGNPRTSRTRGAIEFETGGGEPAPEPSPQRSMRRLRGFTS